MLIRVSGAAVQGDNKVSIHTKHIKNVSVQFSRSVMSDSL